MKKEKEIIERYYRGETSVREEQELRKAYDEGRFPEEPALSLRRTELLPSGLEEQIRQNLHRHKQKRIRRTGNFWMTIAASGLLILAIHFLFPSSAPEELSVSDPVKRERFEDALRIIGNVLEEKTILSREKILYEDDKLIISVEEPV